jgi:4-hydroxybenzoate polyprenyltransferase
MSTIGKYLSLVKFSHTIFAMPFAMTGFFLGVQQNPDGFSWRLLGLVLLCMVFARTAAMAFNRWLDRDIDSENPRTQVREIPSGAISPASALGFVIANCVLFVVTTFFINPLCFWLSPVALAVVLGYSYTKRFTWLCHLVLGVGLGLAPVGAYLAVTGQFAWTPVLYGFAVLTWVAGFDIIYALQDEEFDKDRQLYSIPVLLGKPNALRFSEALHMITAALMLSAGYLAYTTATGGLGILMGIGTVVFLGLLFYQHTLVKPNDLSKVNMAFFTTNGIASVVFGVLMVTDLLI